MSSPSAAPRLHPPPLRPGDTIAVVAPASPFEHVLAWVGLGGSRAAIASALIEASSTEAGTWQATTIAGVTRTRAILDPDVKAIIAARGGYGAHRFAHEIDWAAVAERPRWIVGFSDITALHVELATVGVASIHACHVTSLGRGDAHAREAFVRALERPLEPRAMTGLTTYRPGSAEGALYGGNLTVLHASAAGGRLFIPEGSVLLLEDITERPYRIDRALTTLAVGGHLARASAIVLGDFTECNPGPDRVTAEQVLRERLTRLGVPVVAGLPIGHGLRNEPVILGGPARVEAGPGGASVLLGG